MPRTKKLSYNKLRKECKPGSFKFQDTSKLTFSDDIIGQERAVKAMEFGLKIKTRGYNIFMSGMTGTGKTSDNCIIIKMFAIFFCIRFLKIIFKFTIKHTPLNFLNLHCFFRFNRKCFYYWNKRSNKWSNKNHYYRYYKNLNTKRKRTQNTVLK